MTDIAIKQFDNGSFDIDFSNGDILTDGGLRTAVIFSLFTDREAQPDDVIPDGSSNRRGHWGDIYNEAGEKIGSRLWLLSREKETDAVLRRAEDYADEALQHFVVDGVASEITSVAEWQGDGRMALSTTIKKGDETLFDDVFNLSLRAL